MSAPPKNVGVDARMLSPNPTGVGNYIAALLLPICRENPRSQVFLYSNSSIGFPELPNVTIRASGGSRIGPYWMNFQLPRQMDQDEIEVFWGANGVTPVVGRVRTVVTVHDMVYRFAGKTMRRGARWTKWMFQRWSVVRAEQVIAVSQATAADIASVYHRSVDAIIRPLVDPVFYRRKHEEVDEVLLRYKLHRPFWLSAGTLEPRKNLMGLLRAYVESLQCGLELPTLVLAGASGWGDDELGSLIEKEGLSGQVRRLGYVPARDLSCLYNACELLWMPSIYEGFGMPILEAQRCGAAVVHGNHDSMVEASDGLGVPTATDVTSLRSTIVQVARGEAPLACRLTEASAEDVLCAANRLWACLSEATSRGA